MAAPSGPPTPPELTDLERRLLAPTIDNITNLRYQLSKKDCESFFKRLMEKLYRFPPIAVRLNYTVLLSGQKTAMEDLMDDVLMYPLNTPPTESVPLLEACLAVWSFKNIWRYQQTDGYFESILCMTGKIIQLLKLFSGKEVRMVDFFLAAVGEITTKNWSKLEEEVQKKALALLQTEETIETTTTTLKKGSKRSRNRALHSIIDTIFNHDESKFFEKVGAQLYFVQRKEPGDEDPLGTLQIDSSVQHKDLYDQDRKIVADIYGDFEGKMGPAITELCKKKLKKEEMYFLSERVADPPINKEKMTMEDFGKKEASLISS